MVSHVQWHGYHIIMVWRLVPLSLFQFLNKMCSQSGNLPLTGTRVVTSAPYNIWKVVRENINPNNFFYNVQLIINSYIVDVKIFYDSSKRT